VTGTRSPLRRPHSSSHRLWRGCSDLFFNLGNDWDTAIKAFTVNSSYEVFEDLFNFTTREYEEDDYIRTRYSSFEVTLNPVIGGTAKTENINVVEFANY